MSDPFTGLPREHFGALLVDPPWHFATRSEKGRDRCPDKHYAQMNTCQLQALPVSELAACDSVLILWMIWPLLHDALSVIESWGFTYKTCGFTWAKIGCDGQSAIGTGYWTRANSEVALLATRGKPKRRSASVPQIIIEPRREHSRKPDCVHERIERLVAGPYLELFARQSRPGWTTWGNERTKFDQRLDAAE